MNIQEAIAEIIYLLMNKDFTFSKLFNILLEVNLLYLFLPVLVTLLALIIEIFPLGWKKSSMYRILFDRTNTTRTDIWLYFLGVTYISP